MKTSSTCFAGLVLACAFGSSRAEAPATAEPPACCRQELAPARPVTDASLYQLESRWTSDFGREIQLGILRGRPQLLVMFFAQCEWACPLLLHDLQRIEAALPGELRARLGITLVTFDSERDTVEALHRYREARLLAPQRWTLLRGGPDDVRELAALLGIQYRQDARGQFAHSNLITILNREGEIVHQVKGLNNPPDEAVRVLRALFAAVPLTPPSQTQNPSDTPSRGSSE